MLTSGPCIFFNIQVSKPKCILAEIRPDVNHLVSRIIAFTHHQTLDAEIDGIPFAMTIWLIYNQSRVFSSDTTALTTLPCVKRKSPADIAQYSLVGGYIPTTIRSSQTVA